MSFRDDFYSKEAVLVNKAKRELANGLRKDPMHRLRLMCFTKGATGILELSRCLRKVNNNCSSSLCFEEFVESFKQAGLDWNQNEIKLLFNSFDVKQNGRINTTEFISKLRPAISPSRLNIIDKAFEKIDNNGDGVITVEDLKNIYNVRDHPKYLSGDLTEKEILEQFLHNFNGAQSNKKIKADITKEDFINYYAAISASIDNDAYFDLIMRRAYKL